MQRPAIIVHGGAGTEDTHEHESRLRGCRDAVERGWDVLRRGGTAVDAVVAAVVYLEDDPRFNAGTGSCLTEDGRVEMDASLMDGARLSAGAVGAVERLKNPILLARAIMDEGRHVLLVGPQAAAFARARGFDLCDPASLIVDRQRRRHQNTRPVDGGTVGAAAIDRMGNTAAATSTGGIMGKRAGRVGDSAIIGAGTYADDTLGAASATGLGEAIIRITLCRLALDMLGRAPDPTAAAERALSILRNRLAARCGLIVVDPTGRIGWAFTTESMPVAYMCAGLPGPVVA
jgi:beta-aspartyl-peptidase (threonine type)